MAHADYEAALRAVTYRNSSEAPTPGDRTLSFQVCDGAFVSGVADRTLTVAGVNDPPEILTLTDTPDPVNQGDPLTLTANSVSDVDGTVTQVDFYRDANGNGTLEVGVDLLLGTDSDGGDGWAWLGAATFGLGQQTYFAQAEDNEGALSDPVSATGTIASQPPTVASLADALPFS